MKKILIGLIAIPIVVPAIAYFYHGFHKNYPVLVSKLPAQSVLYIPHIGRYDKINETFRQVGQDLNGETKLFSNARVGSIFYDDPFKLADPSTARSVVGVFVPLSNKAIAEEVQKRFPQYELKDLPEVTTVKSKIRYTSKFTFFWWAISQYPKMYEFIFNTFGEMQENPMVIEFNEWTGHTIGDIESHVPYGPNVSQWFLSKAPEPARKKRTEV